MSNLMNLVSALGVTPMQILYGEADNKENLMEDIIAELNGLDERELKMLLGAIYVVRRMLDRMVKFTLQNCKVGFVGLINA